MQTTQIGCSGTRRARRLARGLGCAAVLLGAPVGAGDSVPTFRIDFTVAPAAGGVVEQNGLRLSYTLAEPVAGPTSGADTRIVAGFQALFRAQSATVIFDDGFEAASP